ncbi:hypothetical protein D6C76_07502 [Aureobasidium pullulans]|nr:hypothetical protein D6C76_07502 [Aureobasidium pullulans]
MSSAQDGPVILKYRPAFALPVLVEYIALSQVDRFQSFPFLPGYQNVSFEEQRLKDTTPLPTMADNKFGILSASSLKSLKAASKFALAEVETRPVSEIHFEGDIEAFEVYTEWVYSGHVFKKKLRDDEGGAKFLSYGQAYILGEKLLDHDFKNEVLDTLLTEILSGAKIDLTLATLVYEGTTKTSPLRRLLVDIYTWYGHKDWLKYGNNKSHAPLSFLSDLSAAFLERHNNDASLKDRYPVWNPCRYHEHPAGQDCPTPHDRSHPRKLATGSEPDTDKVTS